VWDIFLALNLGGIILTLSKVNIYIFGVNVRLPHQIAIYIWALNGHPPSSTSTINSKLLVMRIEEFDKETNHLELKHFVL